ncbi:MAG: imidazoleglycerol-phosphate dehydratase HisB [Eubacteriales bacterium]|nr:imidazoleglycerol-phosphate dehydratase HisB [Eubacteriales bacterium]
MSGRIATIQRDTKETNIRITFNIDGSGICNVDSGIPFLDHMLNGFARHGFFDLDAKIRGDVEVDSHHTIEDTGIVLGEAIRKAAGDKEGILRFGHAVLPMDDALILCAIDLSGRPYLESDLQFTTDRIGDMDTEMVREFFYAISYSAGMNLHFKQFSGRNNHHIAECAFKAFARALDMATTTDERISGVLSTKGTL